MSDGVPESAPLERVVSADGTEIATIDEGAGRPIVIVHGGSSRAVQWAAVARALARGFRVVRVERRLYGGSGTPRSPHAMAREVEDVEAVLAQLGEPALLVGHSSGAIVALETALRRPANLAALAAYEPPVAVNAPLGGAALARARAAVDRGRLGKAMAIHLVDVVEMSRLAVTLMRLTPAWAGVRQWAAAQISDDEAINGLGVGIDRYASITIPTLLLVGGRSPAHLRERLAAVERVIPGARRAEMPNRGHVANLSAPGEVAGLLWDFAETIFGPTQPRSE
jgi:pimeloyl-ACP methyl ester carboxylesterase